MQIDYNGNVPALSAMCVLFRTGIRSPELLVTHLLMQIAARWDTFGRSGLGNRCVPDMAESGHEHFPM